MKMRHQLTGPLIDITVISGKLFEVYLPHWICIDDIPEILQKFAVLHIDDCGDVVEKVSEVTSSHVKLCEPVFSQRAVLIKNGIPVKIQCNVLIYSKAYASCTVLHVYLTPLDPALKETIDKDNKEYKFIRKPRPNDYLTLHKDFNLKADIETDKICPEKITLTNDSQEKQRSIFFDVGFENPNSNFHLTLSQLNKGKRKPQCEPVWSCVIRKVELRNSGDSDVKETGGPPSITVEATGGPSSENGSRDTAGPSAGETAQNTMVDGEHFVDKHRTELIDSVHCVANILDKLLGKKVIKQAIYDKIRKIPTTQEQMRELFSGPLNAAGPRGKEVFYRILEEEEEYLIDDLKGKK
ncbi:NACHT, LRR and PYD domains-containing protein 1b allele 2-like [Trematomus bernacchii]|uniref:NACHT, LRR and PYD domains-containing protein 1b allele 2-like n=1 Tax=Trematomus bernacchii TaxID=40690 RepID=UPI00146B99F3|nr:NACHT, LRR and PYD domains-containing protein 1b allele 2-like [Trematomus bernacchii]